MVVNWINGFASGTFLFVLFFEIAPHEFLGVHATKDKWNGVKKASVMAFGAFCLYLMASLLPHCHGVGPEKTCHDPPLLQNIKGFFGSETEDDTGSLMDGIDNEEVQEGSELEEWEKKYDEFQRVIANFNQCQQKKKDSLKEGMDHGHSHGGGAVPDCLQNKEVQRLFCNLKEEENPYLTSKFRQKDVDPKFRDLTLYNNNKTDPKYVDAMAHFELNKDLIGMCLNDNFFNTYFNADGSPMVDQEDADMYVCIRSKLKGNREQCAIDLEKKESTFDETDYSPYF